MANLIIKEDDILIAFFQWLELKSCQDARYRWFFHVPNEGYRPGASGARAKAKGLKRGVPDVLYPIALGGYRGLALEFKRPGQNVTIFQAHWLDILSAQNWSCKIVRSFEGAKKAALGYIGLKDE